jgi:tetratricopeptide (TPR) repeat protein
MSSNDLPPDPRPDDPAGERLDSWKEIAAFLKRSVRSVQRWEAEEGMPVRRHLHDKRGTIYGFKSELDAWWKERGVIVADRNGEEKSDPLVSPDPDTVDPVPAVEVVPLSRRLWRRVALFGTVFGLALLLVGFVAWLSRTGPSTGSLRPLPFKAREWVLVTSFENRTGESLFDGTLEYAFTRELANSRYVNVVPRERTADALRLMRKASDTRLDAALGREVCLRDGGIRALLAGRIERIGSKYVMSVEIVDPAQGTTLAGFSEQAVRRQDLTARLGHLSDRVRVALGEVLPPIDRTRPSLAKATTRSLKALQLLTQADSLLHENNSSAAEELLRQAVTEDPAFATGWIYLAWTLFNQGKPQSEFLDCAEKALRLSPTTSPREGLFIRASYHDLLHDAPRARTYYEGLLRLYPDHYWATNNLQGLYEQLELDEEAAQLQVRIADLRPTDFEANLWAAYRLALIGGELGTSKKYVEKARALVSEEILQVSPGGVAWLELFPAFEYWLRGEIEESSKAADRVASRIETLRENSRTLFVTYVGSLYLTLGRLRAAEEVFRKDPNRINQVANLSRLALTRRDTDAMRRHLKTRVDSDFGEWGALLLARAGLFDESLRVLAAKKNGFRPGWVAAIQGEVARGRGQIDKGIALLIEGAQRHSAGTGSHRLVLGGESLAEAWRQKGNLVRACQALERASQMRRWMAFDHGGFLWIQNQSRLADLYRQLGRKTEAEGIEDELLKLLSRADSEHPVLLDIRRARAGVRRAQAVG